MLQNGKTIKCKVCDNEIYVSQSRLMTKKYCSSECARKDNFGFIPKKKFCEICGSEFLIEKGIQSNKKTCSVQCHLVLKENISKRLTSKVIKKICVSCHSEFTGLSIWDGTMKCHECRIKNLKENRIGKGNPNFKTGNYTHKNNQGRNKVSYKHLNECRRYKEEFIEKHGYQFCEVCGVNKNGTPRFEVHHIYFASRFPKHKNLHDNKNLIHICKNCHYRFHNGKEYKEVFEKLEEERGLKALFKRGYT